MKIVQIDQAVVPISSRIRNAYINFASMDVSVVRIVTDVVREGQPVVGYGFNSNARYAQAGILADRVIRACWMHHRRPRTTANGTTSIRSSAGST